MPSWFQNTVIWHGVRTLALSHFLAFAATYFLWRPLVCLRKLLLITPNGIVTHIKRYVAETIGTFALVFAGTTAIVINELNGGIISHVGVALTFGLVVMAMIHSVGDVSGAHLNPAVTLGFWASGRLPQREIAPYVLSQCAGAVAASLTVRFLFVESRTLGATLPAGDPSQSFFLEIVLAFIMMFVILGVSTGAKDKGLLAGVAVGGAVALGALFGGPISGASMNPARSLAPALVSGHVHALWIYLTAPVLGSFLAVGACRSVRDSECCRRTTSRVQIEE
ncbi:MAG: aquaporin [Vicinamibacteria bacterium]